jgi:hypothetical protein
LAVLAVALVAAAAAPTPDGSVAVNWGGATSAAISFWLLSFGVPVVTSGVVIDLVPLGLTLAVGLITYVIAQRFTAPRPGSVAVAGLSLGTVVAVTAAASGSGPAAAVQAATWATLVGVVASACGVRRSRGVWVMPAPTFAPGIVRVFKQGVASALLAYGAAAVLLVAGIVAGWTDIARAQGALHADPVGVAVVGIGELAYVPTLVAWMLSWQTGLGFVVGSGSLYSPAELSPEPVPLVPILGALPHAAGGPLVWAPVLMVLVGVAARLMLGPRGAATRQTVVTTVAAAVVAAGVFAVVTTLATGSIGSGHLAVVGADWLSVGAVGGALVGGGGLLGEAIAWWRGTGAKARSARRPRTRRAGPATPSRTPDRTPSAPRS